MNAELREVLGLLSKATAGEFTVKHGTNIMAGDSYSATSTQSNFMDATARNEANAAALIASANFLRKHGPALLAAAQDGEDAARLNALECEVREHGGLRLHTGDFENVRLGVGIHHFDSLRDAIDRLFLFAAARSADAEGR
jgi:hypothetical protein